MHQARLYRFLVRLSGLTVVLAFLWSAPLPDPWLTVIGAALAYFLFLFFSDWIFDRILGQSRTTFPVDPARYLFPALGEEEIRASRMRSFIIGALIAILPAVCNAFWRCFDDGFALTSIYKQALPDFAIAGVGITISAYTSTIYSITKLDGKATTDGLTFFCLVLGTVFALLCFLIYLRATHAHACPFSSG